VTMSFVQALDIARDHRLVGLRSGDAPEITGPRRGGTESASGSAEGPLAISDKIRAAVNAGSLVSFVAGLNAEEKGDVLYSTQLAQRAASAKHDRFAATRDWYGVYVDVLERLGWVGESFAFTDRGSSAGEFSMDKSALEVIATIATSNQLAILVKTLDTLKKLGEDDRAIRIFDLQAMAELSGNFQIGAQGRLQSERGPTSSCSCWYACASASVSRGGAAAASVTGATVRLPAPPSTLQCVPWHDPD
jgi:hypothetical protein